MDALNSNTRPSKEVVCLLLEELVFVLRVWGNVEGGAEFDMGTVIEVVAARASREVKLRTIRGQAYRSSGTTHYMWNTVLRLMCTTMEAIITTRKNKGQKILVMVFWQVDLCLYVVR